MMYSRKSKMDRRNSVMAAVRKELKAHNAFVSPSLLHQLAESIDVSKYYYIEVIRDVEKAAERLCLEEQIFEHSWAGSYGIVETGTKVFGDVVFGRDYSYEFSRNGDSDGPEFGRTEAEFDINQPLCALVQRRDWCNMENDSYKHDDRNITIIIYSPESIINEEEYVAQKAAELKELCQLR